MNKAISWMMVALAAFGLCRGTALGGSGTTNAPAAPSSAGSAMWTLSDIYNVLNTRATNVAQRTGGFTEPGAGPTNGVMYTLNDVMSLVTNRAPVAKTGVTKTYPTAGYAVGDDGWNQIGVAWPNPRFSPVATSGDATNQIRDNLTGLIWARNANLASNVTGLAWTTTIGTCTWFQAFDVITNSAGPVNGANYGGANDWRLPNMRELYSLIDWQFWNPPLSDGTGTNQWTAARGPFINVQNAHYWSSTTYGGSAPTAWNVDFSLGGVTYAIKTNLLYYVWPVRGGGN